MVYAKPKTLQQPTVDGQVVLNIEWFRAEGSETADLHDQVLLPVANIEYVTPETVEDAIARRLPAVEAMLAPAPSPKAEVREILGQVFDAGQIASAVEERRQADKGGRS